MGKRIFAVVCLVGVALVVLVLPRSLEATTIYVNPGESIKDAVNTGVSGDTIIVRAGTYSGPGNRDIDFGGKAITLASESGAASTFIDCQGSGRGFLFWLHEGADSVVEGFTIRNAISPDDGRGGGGVCCDHSSPTIINCTISGNTAITGGGIRCCASNSEITNCTITDNEATDFPGGGIEISFGSNPTITNCTISGNSATSPDVCPHLAWGGGISCYQSSGTITNCAISGNSAKCGGGISCDGSSPTIKSCTISGNSASSSGGGFYCEKPGSTPTLTNCILWGDGGEEIYVLSGVPTVNYCDVEGGWTGEGNIDANPLFEDGYHLGVGSPCIDAGCDAGVYTDIEGNVRPFGAGFDMGAYEAIPEPSVLVVAAFGVLGVLVRRRKK